MKDLATSRPAISFLSACICDRFSYERAPPEVPPPTNSRRVRQSRRTDLIAGWLALLFSCTTKSLSPTGPSWTYH